MHRRPRKVCTALREHSYVSYAKIASASGFSDINVTIIKATTPDDTPVEEKYIQHLLRLFSISPSSCHSFALSFTRRFGTTRSWRVALKCLILLHRLLRSVPGNSPLWTELLWTRSNGLISLYPCHFRDNSSSCSDSYTNFIRSYAQLVDEALNCVMVDGTKFENQDQEQEQGQEEQEEKEGDAMHETFQEKMKEMGEVLELLPQLQSVIDRVMDCFPVGVAARSFMVQSAMKLIIRDSFVCYTKFRKEITAVLDNLLQMPYRNCIAAFNIYKKASVQSNQLYEFYEWCKVKRLCGSYEYPLVEPIPHIQIKALETFLSGMWQLTESSSPTSSSSSSEESRSLFTEGEGEKQLVVRRDIVNIKGQGFADEEERPLIDREDDKEDDVSWETLLETSITFSHQSDLMFSLSSNGYQWGCQGGFNDEHSIDGKGIRHNGDADDGRWKIAVYQSPAAAAAANNPFSQPNEESINYYGRFARNPS